MLQWDCKHYSDFIFCKGQNMSHFIWQNQDNFHHFLPPPSLCLFLFLFVFAADVLRHIHPFHQTGAADVSDWETLRPAGIPAHLSTQPASPPAIQSQSRLSRRPPLPGVRIFSGSLWVPPAPDGSGEARWWDPVGAQCGQGKTERQQRGGM